MRVLLLSYYFEPAAGPAARRASAIARSLCGDCDLVVATASPAAQDRFKGFRVVSLGTDLRSRSKMLQIFRFIFFSCAVIRRLRLLNADIVVVTSSRLGTAALGLVLSKVYRARLIVDLRDLLPLFLRSVYGRRWALLRPALQALESRIVKAADKVVVTSGGYSAYLIERYGASVAPIFVPHGELPSKGASCLVPDLAPNKAIRLVYAGTVGRAQGLSQFLPEVARRLDGRVLIDVYGDGSGLAELKKEIRRLGCVHTLRLKGPLAESDMLKRLPSYDFGIVSLIDDEDLNRAIPSKIYDLVGAGLPIIAGVRGYARKFLESLNHPSKCFDPCSADAFVELLVDVKSEWNCATENKIGAGVRGMARLPRLILN